MNVQESKQISNQKQEIGLFSLCFAWWPSLAGLWPNFCSFYVVICSIGITFHILPRNMILTKRVFKIQQWCRSNVIPFGLQATSQCWVPLVAKTSQQSGDRAWQRNKWGICHPMRNGTPFLLRQIYGYAVFLYVSLHVISAHLNPRVPGAGRRET